MHTIYIISSQHHQNIKDELLKESDFLLHTQVLDFDVAFNITQDLTELKLEAFKKLNSLKLELLSSVINHLKTTETMIKMIQDMHLYNIALSDLPLETDLDKEIHLCLSSIYSLVQTPKVDPNTKYIVYDHFLTHAQLSFIKHNNIELKTKEISAKQEVYFRNSLNIRHEIEAAVQDILQNDIPCATFVIPQLQSQIPLIESIFSRYSLPLQLEDRSLLILKKQYLAMFNLYLNPNITNFINVLESNALKLKRQEDIIFLYNHLNLSFPLLHLPTSENRDTQRIIENAQESLSVIFDFSQDFENLPFKQASISAYNYLLTNSQYKLKPIKKFLEQNLDLFDETTDHLFVDFISALSSQSKTESQFKFYDLNDFSFLPESRVYAINLTASNFPSISANTGIFEESYLNRIKDYPSLENRTKHSIRNKETFLNQSETLYLSHSISNYEGKAQEVSLAIEDFARSHNAQSNVWPLKQIEQKSIHYPKLSTELAQALFMENSKMLTSVSALQLYMNDPYQFFIERGLKLREPRYPIFDPMLLGNINHAYMENIIKNPKFEYETLIQDSQTHSKITQMIHERNKALMNRNKAIIIDSLSDTRFETIETEYRIDAFPLFNKFKINGFVDRIDSSDNHLMIIDYKSSAHKMSASQFKAGTQLQLLTYALIISKVFDKKIFGIFYYGFNETNIAISNYKYSLSKAITQVEDSIEDLYMDSKKHTGWIFDSLNELMSSGNYFSGIKELKKGLSVSPKPYNWETTIDVLESIYEAIYNNIANGVLNPYEIQLPDLSEINLKEALEDEHTV